MANPEKSPSSSSGLDFATIAGLAVAVGSILTGLLMEGGKVADVAQVTSALIVLGGTLGAVMVTTPANVLMRAARQFPSLFFGTRHSTGNTIDEIIEYAVMARKNGIVSLEDKADRVHDPFLRKALGLAVDGIDTSVIRDIMELEINNAEQSAEAEAKVYEAAGGYAPTIGIIGAVLGLIQVMKNLTNFDEVGRGIAVAFVATIYGVSIANIVFLPAAAKIKARAREAVHAQELMLEGVMSIAEGLNLKLIRVKLEAYSHNPRKSFAGPPPAPNKAPAVERAAA